MTRSVFKLLVALAFALSFVGAAERAVLAAPPANDLRSGATLVTVGFSESLDTSEATTDAEDAIMNSGVAGGAGCGFPATDASVWYQFVGTGEKVSLNVFQSDFSAGVIAASPNQVHVACGWGGVDFVALSGVTYYILAFDDQSDGVGTGGMLNISITLGAADPPPPAVTLSVDRFGTVNARTGVVTISGTYSCVDADSFFLYPNVWQDVGVFFTIGFVDLQFEGTCDGGTHTWSGDVYPLLDEPLSRKFVGGKALALVAANSFGPHGYGEGAYIEQEVILRGK